MILQSLSLTQFRNFSSLDLACTPGITLFLGDNAQGKSNLLEAIYFISTGRSFRTSKLSELIRWGQAKFEVRCAVECRKVFHRIDAEVGARQCRWLWDGKPRRGTSIFGHFKAVIFASEDLDVVRQEPATRRKFFDLFFSQIDEEYGRHLDDYGKVVRSRNLLLREESYGELGVWDELLIREGSWLIWQRKRWLSAFEQTATPHHTAVSAKGERMKLSYKTACGQDANSQEDVAKALHAKIAEHAEHEKILKTTLAGPHRDDYEISIDGRVVRHFGSEGQKRSAMLSLRLAQWKFLADISGEVPMILLDDVLGELDEERQTAFLDLVAQSGAQTFIALTQARDSLLQKVGAMFEVSAGTLGVVNARTG